MRCHWVNLNNKLYIDYHDNEWGRPLHNDHDLIELLILESFQAGLSWECILNKREAFRKAFDNFDIDKIVKYDDNKINSLLNNKDIIRNKLKIKATITNCKIIKEIISEYTSFNNYIWSFTNNKTIVTTNIGIEPTMYKSPSKFINVLFSFVATAKSLVYSPIH